MDDLISRQAVIDAIEKNAYRHTYLDQIIDIIKALPSARPSGSWIYKTGVYGVVYCSRCDYELHSNNTNFYPNRGADMKGSGE